MTVRVEIMGIEREASGSYEALLMEYACGVLCDHMAAAVSTHLALAPEARRAVALYERLGGTLMQQECEPVAMGAGSLRAVLGRLDCARTAAACNPPPEEEAAVEGLDDMPSALCRFLQRQGLPRLRWRPVRPGIHACFLPAKGGAAGAPYAALMRMAPGRMAPGHRHRGREVTLVLKGALRDENGVYARGTLLVLDGDSHHTPMADQQAGCVCLVVSEGPVIPFQQISRLVSRLFSA